MRYLLGVALLLTACMPKYSQPTTGLLYREGCIRQAEAAKVFVMVVVTAKELGMLKRWPVPDKVVACVKSTDHLACNGNPKPLKGCTYVNRVWLAGLLPDWKRVAVHEYIVALSNTGALSLPGVTAATEAAWTKRKDYRMLHDKAIGKL